MRTLFFFHGAGGFVEDGPLARGVGEQLGARVVMPELPDENMTFEGWAAPIRQSLAAWRDGDHVVGHSFGASILVRVLAEGDVPVPRATLLAMPDWSEQGWGVADYDLPSSEPATRLTLHHCTDDEVVPVDHLNLHAARLPSAQRVVHATGGHQFEGRCGDVAAVISAGTTS